ncbi:DUF4389 domain-containing protein [Thermoactinospora rubra]|uniref:DUF4389 domain-containing protein n=1 Tax=Thermoactinospora rubra TaxID=1088767 RepID=UPI000A122B51
MDTYPVRVEARLDEPLNRGLWLVKWLLATPHYVVLTFLWIAFCVLTVVAFFAILFTGVYPRALFDFNVGVLRWTWRVAFYTYGALGTDRYPPFTLGSAPDYPATLDVDYPERLSRGLVLVKWWLLALPHYLVVAVFTSGGALSWRDSAGVLYTLDWGGLIGLLVLIAAVALLFTGRYPRGLFDLVVGLNRWALRVAAYATLMTDAYPPFRLDLRETPPTPAAPPPRPAVRYGAGSIVAIVTGTVLAFAAIGGVATGVAAVAADRARDAKGFVGTDGFLVSTPTHALAAEDVDVAEGAWFLRRLVGQVRIDAEAIDDPLFVGIAPQEDAAAYLARTSHEALRPEGADRTDRQPGGAPAQPPTAEPFWVAQVSGPGSQSLVWDVQPGDWALVVMNADGSPGVSAELRVAGTLPWLSRLAAASFVLAGVLLLAGAALIVLGVRLGTRHDVPVEVSR